MILIVSVVASGIDIIFFLSENTTMQIEFFYECAHFITMSFHCTFKVSDTKAGKKKLQSMSMTKADL